MAFGRRKKDRDSGAGEEVGEVGQLVAEDKIGEPGAVARADFEGDFDGPFDIEDFDNPDEALLARLDLGSVLVPMPPGGQIQVELNQQGVPSAIWVVTPNGRFTIAAYAAPKSPGLWREVASELAEALRNDNASVSIEDGPWADWRAKTNARRRTGRSPARRPRHRRRISRRSFRAASARAHAPRRHWSAKCASAEVRLVRSCSSRCSAPADSDESLFEQQGQNLRRPWSRGR